MYRLAGVMLLLASKAAAYQVSCNGQAFSVDHSSLTSVFGEVRSEVNCSTCITPTRFHQGADVTNTCRTGNTVQSIFGGTVQNCTSSEGGCVKVADTTSHAMVYDHVINPVYPPGQVVQAGWDLGDIDSQNHLHLQEDMTLGGSLYRTNPLLRGRLSYSDSTAPRFVSLKRSVGHFSPTEAAGLFRPVFFARFYLRSAPPTLIAFSSFQLPRSCLLSTGRTR